MCYYSGRRVSHSEYDRLIELEKHIAFLSKELAIEKGFDFNEMPIMKPAAETKTTERVNAEWGFIPSYIRNREQADRMRKGYKDERGWHAGYNLLNATSEELLSKIYKSAAKKTRCLIPSNGFYEWRHVQVVGKSGKLLKTPEKFPYLVEVKGQPEFYIAGVYNTWTDQDSGKSIDTFAIVTTAANSLMQQIHNSKERMPTILPGDLAEAWLYKELSDQDILDIANYQIASAEMQATPLHKDFLKRDNPHDEVKYAEVQELVC